MVMEATPSPQCVGREFVRQYYTLLNEAPAHLHRFYNNNSSFVHGGLDVPHRETKPVVGQKQIHQKIQQLNFRDCHAKIIQVDSLLTLGDGVVVQVTGELSNSGQPMRRFTQTFVLAAQSPKKYYVHNDIFRYQDMLFSDEEAEQDSDRSETEEDADPELHQPSEVIQPRVQQSQPMSVSSNLPYFNNANAVSNNSVPPQDIPPQLAPTPAVVPTQQLIVPPQQAVLNGTHPDEHMSVAASPVTPTTANLPVEETAVPEQDAASNDEQEHIERRECDDEEERGDTQENLEDSPHLIESASNEPKTYATLVKTGGIGVGTASFSTAATSSSTPVKPTSSPPPVAQHSMDMQVGGLGSGGPGGMNQGQRGARARGGGNIRGMVRSDRGGTGRGSYSDDNGNMGADGERRRMGSNVMQQYPDSHQVFLGNIPHHVTENELKDLFSKYGRIVNLRIHSKQNASNRPHYGFLIFEEASTVQSLLHAEPIMINKQKLNIEEKKPSSKFRIEQQSRISTGGDSMMSGGRPNSGLGGPRGGGMIRGGAGLGGHHRGGGRGGFGRGDGRGGGISRGNYTRR